MADEIPGQNVIRVVLRPPGVAWCAYIGPDIESGIRAGGSTPTRAINALSKRLDRAGYVFDASWRPRE